MTATAWPSPAGSCNQDRSKQGRELQTEAQRANEPYAFALATVRLAIDTTLDEPGSAREALRDAQVASTYPSRYIRDYATAAHGRQEVVFGDLALVVEAGRELVTSATRPIQDYGEWLLAVGGLLRRDERRPSLPPAKSPSAPSPDRSRAPRPGSTSRDVLPRPCSAGSLRASAWSCRRSPTTGSSPATTLIEATSRRPGPSRSLREGGVDEAGDGPRRDRAGRGE